MTRARAGSSRAVASAILALALLGGAGPAHADTRVPIEGGLYRPLFRQTVRGSGRDSLVRRAVAVRVEPFEIERHAVTNAEYLAFVTAHPEWRRSRVSRLFADTGYLRLWRADLEPGPEAPPHAPVVCVSWFAARAYASAAGGRLPTVAEWELVASADERRRDASRDPRFLERVREWTSKPAVRVLPDVGSTYRNVWGVEDLHGLIWEWTLDFNSALVSGESRADASLDRTLYCGAAASGASDFADYAAFMRFAFRSSLDATHTASSLGFRVAYDAASATKARP